MLRDTFYPNESQELVNPFEEVGKKENKNNKYDYKRFPSNAWKYVDDWIPGEQDIIFSNVVGAIIVPICKFYQFKDE